MSRCIFLCALWLGLAGVFPAAADDFRAAWVASVHNINFPSKQGLSAEAQKREIAGIVAAAKRSGINQLLVQVRPECDALYQSGLEPWSRFLTGTQGASPGYDPLEVFIAEGRRNGVAIHAWINPYRAAANNGQKRAGSHVANKLSRHVRRIGSQLWLDPGAPEVQEHVVAVVRDLLRRYSLAGVHIDDYFYPYPSAGVKAGQFPDSETYARYRSGGGKLALADWRRQNVNVMVKRLHDTVKSERPGALFGVSPFGIYTKGQPADVKAGLDQLNELYADVALWMRQGWLDYLAPQLYWRDGSAQSFTSLLRWWRSPAVNPRGIPIYPGIALDRMGGSHGWPVTEIATQLRQEKAIGPRDKGGFVLFHMKPVQQNMKGVLAVIGGS
jgi:uncharacterized lipoprotein YddW (UPF0748 family)